MAKKPTKPAGNDAAPAGVVDPASPDAGGVAPVAPATEIPAADIQLGATTTDPSSVSDQKDHSGSKMPEAQADTARSEKPYIRVVATGPRRRAGLSFSPVPIDLKWSDLGADDDARKATEKALIADPELAIAFYDHEGKAD